MLSRRLWRELLAILPPEIIEKDYGCGDPSRYVRQGDVVLDLGSGSGKICYMAAQLVGESGKVIGVDMNDDMLHWRENISRKWRIKSAQTASVLLKGKFKTSL